MGSGSGSVGTDFAEGLNYTQVSVRPARWLSGCLRIAIMPPPTSMRP